MASRRYMHILQLVLLGLKALHKLDLEGDATSINPSTPQYTLSTYLATAQQAVPNLASNLQHMSDRLQHQLRICNPDSRKKLLNDRDGYMSCAGLQRVAGNHYAVGARHKALQNPREIKQLVLSWSN
eukprot:GHRR01021521.1.p2 GENE.GHRR01021521.1~~GHRR01021521.1.p2  ORF type:complete len:127 (+),score=46.18 GHRR01021521.1:892-1272(+)